MGGTAGKRDVQSCLRGTVFAGLVEVEGIGGCIFVHCCSSQYLQSCSIQPTECFSSCIQGARAHLGRRGACCVSGSFWRIHRSGFVDERQIMCPFVLTLAMMVSGVMHPKNLFDEEAEHSGDDGSGAGDSEEEQLQLDDEVGSLKDFIDDDDDDAEQQESHHGILYQELVRREDDSSFGRPKKRSRLVLRRQVLLSDSEASSDDDDDDGGAASRVKEVKEAPPPVAEPRKRITVSASHPLLQQGRQAPRTQHWRSQQANTTRSELSALPNSTFTAAAAAVNPTSTPAATFAGACSALANSGVHAVHEPKGVAAPTATEVVVVVAPPAPQGEVNFGVKMLQCTACKRPVPHAVRVTADTDFTFFSIRIRCSKCYLTAAV